MSPFGNFPGEFSFDGAFDGFACEFLLGGLFGNFLAESFKDVLFGNIPVEFFNDGLFGKSTGEFLLLLVIVYLFVLFCFKKGFFATFLLSYLWTDSSAVFCVCLFLSFTAFIIPVPYTDFPFLSFM